MAGKQWCEETDRSAASNPEGSTRKPEGKAQQATAENAERKGRSEGKESPSDYTYKCPFCDGTIESKMATGRISHRQVCGHRFRVDKGAVVGAVPNSVMHTYRCPFCEGTIESPLATGCIDHRAVCGHQFRVENGARISSPKHEHPCPACGTLVTSAKATGRIQSSHKDASGNQCGRKEWVVK